jgi:hypothetical protein
MWSTTYSTQWYVVPNRIRVPVPCMPTSQTRRTDGVWHNTPECLSACSLKSGKHRFDRLFFHFSDITVHRMDSTMTTQRASRRRYSRLASMRTVLSVLLLLSVHLVAPSCAQRMITSLGMKLKKNPKQPPSSTNTNHHAAGELWMEQPAALYYSLAAAILLAAIGSKLLLAGESQDWTLLSLSRHLVQLIQDTTCDSLHSTTVLYFTSFQRGRDCGGSPTRNCEKGGTHGHFV